MTRRQLTLREIAFARALGMAVAASVWRDVTAPPVTSEAASDQTEPRNSTAPLAGRGAEATSGTEPEPTPHGA